MTAMVHTAVRCLVLLLAGLVCIKAEVRECSVSRDRVLTTFSGETVTLTLPCKYRMADFTCGDYQVKVTPGNGVVKSDSSLRPVTVRAVIQNTVRDQRADLRTSLKRLTEGWKNKDGSDVGLDYAGYDASQKLAAVRKDGVFDVEFTADGDVTVRCRADNFQPKPMPESMCGDGSASAIEEQAAITQVSKEGVVSYLVLLNDHVVQSKTCAELASTVRNCGYYVMALQMCDVIINTSSPQYQCLVTSEKPLTDYYTDCLSAGCTFDVPLLREINNFMRENCESVELLPEER